MSSRKRLVVIWALCLAALGLAGLLSLDVALRLGTSRTEESVTGDEADTRGRLAETLTWLVSRGNRESHERQWETARWLSARCAELGYKVEVLEYERDGERWPNVVATRIPLSPSVEHVVAMAHLDSATIDRQGRAPGADDNGSGVAVLLEVARRLWELEAEHPIAFCFFSNEEADTAGSTAFARWARQQKLRIVAAVNVDVVGHNRPARLIDWSVIAAQSWRQKGRAVWDELRNGARALRKGPNALIVAGRPKNGPLVEQVARALERRGRLSVFEDVRDDCG
jgi:hypothetical protein